FTILAHDSSLKVLAYEAQAGEVTWGVTPREAATATPIFASGSASVTGGMMASAGSVTASIGSVTCTPATFQNYAAPSASTTFQVEVASSLDETPISGATVVLTDAMQAAQTAMTDSTGLAT